MRNKAEDVRSYDFQQQDELFFDANIWLLIYGPQEPRNTARMKNYSSAFHRIRQAESKIYIDVLIASEFINTYARQKWRFFAKSKELNHSLTEEERGNFKKFRNSHFFKPIAQEIADNMKRILGLCHRVETGFEVLDVDRMINGYKDGTRDFNDQIFEELCKKRGLKLVTDDGDFKLAEEISILTANEHLLA